MNDPGFDEGLVQRLLQEQHPDLADLGLREVAGGWDNQMWRLGDELAVRMPHTPRAPSLLANERRWLTALAPLLPLPVPVHVRTGEPCAHFPRPWAVVAWVTGEPADYAPISRGEQSADTLAAFLRALHRDAPAEAPANPTRGIPLKSFAADFERSLLPIASTDAATVASVREIWEQAVAAPEWHGAPVWLHGDLHPANVVTSDGTLCGVIDFGELCAGDPATDLSAAWLLLPAGAASRFFNTYASADAALLRRARGWAVLRSLGLIAIGQAGDRGLPGGKPTWGPAGRLALERVLASFE